jgi:hypothetical protein
MYDAGLELWVSLFVNVVAVSFFCVSQSEYK